MDGFKNIPTADKQELKKAMQSYFATKDKRVLFALPHLAKVNPAKAAFFKQLFVQALQAQQMNLVAQLPMDLAQKDHYIVVLGYALAKNGEMQQPLLQRLQTTLQLAQAYPQAKIVVSGGAAVKQQTEAQVMQAWLIKHQVAAERIILENHSANTRENALYTLLQLANQQVAELTLVTSASHLRRALFIFKQTKKILDPFKQWQFKINYVASIDEVSALSQLSEVENWLIFEDALRLYHHW